MRKKKTGENEELSVADVMAEIEADKEKDNKKEKKRKKEKKQKPETAETADNAVKGSVWAKLRLILIIVLVVAALCTAGLAYAGYKVTNSSTNYPNVCVGDVRIGGMTVEQAAAALEANGWNELLDANLELTMPLGVKEKIAYFTAGMIVPADEAARQAFSFGHSGNWFKNLKTYVNCLVNEVDVSEEAVNLNAAYIYSNVDSAIKSFDRLMEDKGYSVNEETKQLTMLKGAGKVRIDRDELYNKIVDAMGAGELKLEYMPVDDTLAAPDFNAIHAELVKAPENAYYDTEIREIVPSADGFEFDPAEALSLWKEAELCSVVEIPVEVVEPEVTTEKLKNVIFADVLGSMTTSFAGSSENRINNLRMACSKINGLVLNPGETFSYNETLGQRTEANGFLPAGAYADGEVVEEVGGGICQISSTLYAATLYARLKTVSRECHYFAVAYMDKGIDATVSWPRPDFKFQNNTEYPIKLVVWFDDYDTRTVTIEIMGTAKDNYRVELWHEAYPLMDDFEYDGVTYSDVHVGTATLTYRDIYDEDGNRIIREPVNTTASGDVYYDHYHFHKEDILANLGIDPDAEPGRTSIADEIGGTGSIS